MGKLGDIIFFSIWVAQIAMMEKISSGILGEINPYMFIDFMGSATSIANLKVLMGTTHFSVGIASFNANLNPILFPGSLWSDKLLALRCASAMLALLPLLPAIMLFHRFSPDRVKVAQTRKRRSPLSMLNHLLRPFARLSQPLFRLAQTLPGLAGQICADIALTVASNSLTGLALLILPMFGIFSRTSALPGLLTISIAIWAILICDMSSRDHLANTGEITGALTGGISQRYIRQFAATALLGLLLTGVIAIRWSMHEPVRAMALLSGIFSMSAVACLLGRLSKTPRTFLSLFLFTLYVAVNAVKVPMIDIFGFNGVATSQSMSWQITLGLSALAAGYIYNRRATA